MENDVSDVFFGVELENSDAIGLGWYKCTVNA